MPGEYLKVDVKDTENPNKKSVTYKTRRHTYSGFFHIDDLVNLPRCEESHENDENCIKGLRVNRTSNNGNGLVIVVLGNSIQGCFDDSSSMLVHPDDLVVL